MSPLVKVLMILQVIGDLDPSLGILCSSYFGSHQGHVNRDASD
jgi:hypothetical protein